MKDLKTPFCLADGFFSLISPNKWNEQTVNCSLLTPLVFNGLNALIKLKMICEQVKKYLQLNMQLTSDFVLSIEYVFLALYFKGCD